MLPTSSMVKTHIHTHTHSGYTTIRDFDVWMFVCLWFIVAAGQQCPMLTCLSVAVRSVCFHPRSGEVPAPVYFRALRETFRHEVCPSGHHSYHRTENRYNRIAIYWYWETIMVRNHIVNKCLLMFFPQKSPLLPPARCQKSWPHRARTFIRVSL